MSEFLGDMLRDEPAPAEEVVSPAETPVEPQVEQQPDLEPTSDPEPAPEPTPEPEAPREEERTVPLATFIDQRAELRELKRWKEQQEAQARQPAAMPDPFDDPEGYAASIEQKIEQGRVQERFAFSDTIARQQHGAETVDKAVEWAQSRAQQDPTFAGAYMRQQHPIDWIVQQHKRDAVLSEIGDRSMDDFVRDYLTRNPGLLPQSAPVAAAPAAVAAQPAIKPAAPPRSIASELSPAPAVTPEGDKEGFLAAFTRK